MCPVRIGVRSCTLGFPHTPLMRELFGSCCCCIDHILNLFRLKDLYRFFEDLGDLDSIFPSLSIKACALSLFSRLLD